jgi:hypothetical protein
MKKNDKKYEFIFKNNTVDAHVAYLYPESLTRTTF